MKKKRFPTSIIILGRKYKIKQGANLVYNGQTCYGLCDNNERIIYLEKNQDEQVKKETLLHEACHALLFITGIDQKLSDAENEMYAQLFTAWFHDVEKALK
jgi:Zn-dependent peptidase ImmA (M78 family)